MDNSTPEAVAALTRQQMWQPGVGLRIAPTEDGKGLRGITVNQDIWGQQWGQLAVNTWDTTRATAFQTIGTFDVTSVVGGANGV